MQGVTSRGRGSDFLTFGVMLWIFQAGPELFRAGWFIESLATQTQQPHNEIRERLGRSPAQKPVNGSRMEHNCTAHDRRVAQE